MKKPPPLKNDCFALPQGTNWTPVDDALERLKSVSRQTLPLMLLMLKIKRSLLRIDLAKNRLIKFPFI